MATIHKLTKDGSTIFPATITDAIVHPNTGKTLTSMIKDYNVSELFPSEGLDGGNKYNLALAIQVLGTHLTAAEKTGGIKITFISSVSPYPEEEYYLNKNTWSTTLSDWGQRFEVGGVIANPSGSWEPGTAEEYIDQQAAILTSNLAAETIGRQTVDSNLQTQINSEVSNRTSADTTQNNRLGVLEEAYRNLTESDVIVGPRPTTGQQANVIYREPDQDHTPPQFYCDYMWYNNEWVLMAQYDNGIDDNPLPTSNNLVKSKGVFNSMGAYDISADHNGQTYPDLTTALGDVPSGMHAGGMSVKFIQETPAQYTVVKTENLTTQPTGTALSTDPNIVSGTYSAAQLNNLNTVSALPSTLNSSKTYYLEVSTGNYTSWVVTYVQTSDNKYVQYRLMTDSWSITKSDWQGVESEPKNGSKNFVESNGIANTSYKKAKFFSNSVRNKLDLNFYFKELYIEGLDENTDYCLRSLLKRQNGTSYVFYIGTANGETIHAEIPIPVTSNYVKAVSGGIKVYALMQGLNFNGGLIFQNIDTTICALDKNVVTNLENSPYIASIIKHEIDSTSIQQEIIRAEGVEQTLQDNINKRQFIYSYIIAGTPYYDFSSLALTLPNGTKIYIPHEKKTTAVELAEDLVFTKTESTATRSWGRHYLIYNYKTESKKYIPFIWPLVLEDGDLLLADIQWSVGIINCNFRFYDSNKGVIYMSMAYSDISDDVDNAIDEKLALYEKPKVQKLYNVPINFKKQHLKILDIGNSYSVDAMHYIPEICQAAGLNENSVEFSIYSYYRGGGSFKSIYDCYNSADTRGYTVSKKYGETISTVQTGSVPDEGSEPKDGTLFVNLLNDTKWDIIIFHQASKYAVDYSVWQSNDDGGYLNKCIQLFKTTNPQASLGFMLVHSYARRYSQNTEHSTILRWQKIADSVKYFIRDYGINFIIPYGTAVENLRSSSLNSDTYDFSKDGLHMADGIGDYVASCCFFQSLIAPICDISVIGNTWRKTDFDETQEGVKNINDANAALAQKAAMWATYNWYDIVNPENL